jgi:hypothetical protein
MKTPTKLSYPSKNILRNLTYEVGYARMPRVISENTIGKVQGNVQTASHFDPHEPHS